MSRNVRKLLSLLSLIFLTLFLAAAMSVICLKHGSGIQTPVAVADEVQPADDAEKTVVTVPADMITEYTGKDKADLIRASKPGLVINEIFNSAGMDVTVPQEGESKAKGAKDAGVYTVFVSPDKNCVWPGGGTEERSFKLTINKVTLGWMYKGEDVTELYAETTYSWNINRINDITAKYGENITYSKGVSDPDDEDRRSFTIIKNENTDVPIKSTVTDAGEYTFTVEDPQNYLNPTFTYKILPRNLNFCDPYYLKWILDDSGYKELNTSQVYEYTYNEVGSTEQRSFYTASEMSHAPYSNWENWKDATKYEYTYNEAESTEVKTYVSATRLDGAPDESWENWQCVFEPSDDYTENKTTFAYRQGALNTIRLNNDSGDAAYFAVDYVSGTAGSEPGRYTAVATIKPISNYNLTYTPSTNLGMEIVPNEDGTYSITKTWYILQYLNEFIASSSAETGRKEAYVFPEGWTFGSFPAGGISAPCVTHGDEIIKEAGKDAEFRGAYSQPNGYALSVNMERIVEVNGNKIIYAVKTEGWQNGSEDIVTFTITCGENIICENQPRSKFTYYVNEYMPVGKYNITFTAKSISFRNNHHDWWSGFMGANCGSDYIGTDISFDFEVYTNTACTYNDSLLNFYGHDKVTPFEVDFSEIKGNYDNFFAGTYGIVGVEGAIRKSEILQSGTYWATVADEYFDEIPYLTFSLSYENAEYLVGSAEQWAELVPRVGTYTFYYAINMRNHNGVVAADGSKFVVITLYEVLEIPEFIKVEYTGEAQTVLPEVEDTRYTISGNVQTGVGSYTATLTISDPVHYRWKGVEGAAAAAEYEITKATNYWITELSLSNYKWNSFDRNANLINGTPTVGTPVFTVSTDARGVVPVEGLASFTLTDGKVSAEAEAVFRSLKCRTYYLWASVAETATHKPIEKASCTFTVELADNSWVVETGLNNYKWNSFDRNENLISGAAAYSYPIFTVTTDKEGLMSVSGLLSFTLTDGKVDAETEAAFKSLECGTYYLWASVAETATHKPMEKVSCTFTVELADNSWVVKHSLNNYKWNEFDRNENLITGAVEYSYPVFTVTTDEEGLISVKDLASFTLTDGKVDAETEAVFKSLKCGTYYLWASVAETATHKPIERVSCTFTVGLAENSWVTAPDIKTWTDGAEPNLPTAASLYGTVNYKIVAENDETQVYYDSVSGVDNLAGMHAGSYILIASVEGTQDMYKGIELTKTFVVKSSSATPLTVFLIILVVILSIAIIVLVILLIIYNKKLSGGGGSEPLKEHQDEGHRIVEEEGEPEEAQLAEAQPEQPEDELQGAEETVTDEPSEEEPEEEEPEEETPEEEEPAVEEQDVYEQFEEGQPEELQPAYQQPAYQQPVYQPMYDMYGRPMYDMYGRPMYQQVYGQPVEEQPVYEQPVEEQPVYEQPEQFEESVAEEPVAEEPVAEEPVAEESVAEEPVAEESVAEESVAEEPVAEEPVAEEPVAEEPVAEEPVAEEPVAEEPVAEDPVAEEPVAEEPVAEEPVAEEPVAEEPVAEEAPKPDEGEGE